MKVENNKTISISRAKENFSAAIREAESGETIVITRHGKAVAALVDADELEHLQRLRAAGPTAGLASVVGGWSGSDELVKQIEETGREGSRSVPDPED